MFDVDHDEERAASVGKEVNGFSFEGMDAEGMDYALNRCDLQLARQSICLRLSLVLFLRWCLSLSQRNKQAGRHACMQRNTGPSLK